MKLDTEILRDGVEQLRAYKRAQVLVEDWFFVQEIHMQERENIIAEGKDPFSQEAVAECLCKIAERMPISIPPGSCIVGSQDCAFSPSYALINPTFRVEEFAGYCDPTAIYNDISPNPESGITEERISKVRKYWEQTPYVKKLQDIYTKVGKEAQEVVYFMEPVTGHTIPDMRPFLQHGVKAMQEKVKGTAMAKALEAVLILADRYRKLAENMLETCEKHDEKMLLSAIIDILTRVPQEGAKTFHEAVQSFALLWQVMVLEQAPNPYAFSAGNLDRVFALYFDANERDEAIELIRHLLCFYQVGSRCWAISQNVIVAGRDEKGQDLTSEMTYVILDAFFASNDPQPALSVKVHSKTPEKLYQSLGRFFFTPGHSTPSMFNDDTLFTVLRKQGVAEEDLPDYAIAGCQEPLIMGKASLNTTNTWLNLAKVLELVCNDGCSLITGEKIGPSWQELGLTAEQVYGDLKEAFFQMLDYFLPHMQEAGNACTSLLGEEKPVPFTSAVMDSVTTMRDMRDPKQPGVRYNGSGCLIHGLSVVTDSIYAVQKALASNKWTFLQIQNALKDNFASDKALQSFLLSQDKFGNNCTEVDEIAVTIANQVSEKVTNLTNPAGNKFLADWSTPSTHLLYGYWVGATPDGREARTMLGYGLDPLPQVWVSELPERFISAWKLPYLKMTGGYASHIGVRPTGAKIYPTLEGKGEWMRDRIIKPLFRLGENLLETPYYVYFNVDDAEHLRAVLRDPKKYAPSGVYIMRIHGTFVNFLDLSPAIQEDIIARIKS
jgi:pyruvate-formate lyase